MRRNVVVAARRCKHQWRLPLHCSGKRIVGGGVARMQSEYDVRLGVKTRIADEPTTKSASIP